MKTVTLNNALLVALIALAAILIVGRYQLHLSNEQLKLDVAPTPANP